MGGLWYDTAQSGEGLIISNVQDLLPSYLSLHSVPAESRSSCGIYVVAYCEPASWFDLLQGNCPAAVPLSQLLLLCCMAKGIYLYRQLLCLQMQHADVYSPQAHVLAQWLSFKGSLSHHSALRSWFNRTANSWKSASIRTVCNLCLYACSFAPQ